MNVEGGFRYADYGAYDGCIDFLEYLEECEHNWEEALVSWYAVSGRRKQDLKVSQNYWAPWNLVEVCIF